MLAILGVNGVPLGLPDVLQALQTGTVQACAAPPLAAVALQWYPKLKYMTDRPPVYAIGALVVKKSVVDRLAPRDRPRPLPPHRRGPPRHGARQERDAARGRHHDPHPRRGAGPPGRRRQAGLGAPRWQALLQGAARPGHRRGGGGAVSQPELELFVPRYMTRF